MEIFMPYDNNKEVARFAITETLAFLRALHWLHWTNHWQVKGDYGNHLLFERLYTGIVVEIDSLAEKIVTYFGEESVNPFHQTQLMANILTWEQNEDPIILALDFEIRFQLYLKRTHEMLQSFGRLPLGLDDFLQGVANSHETNVYLLNQVGKKGKTASSNSTQITADLVESVANKFLAKSSHN